MKGGEKIIQLACWPEHQFHEDCYNNFIAHFEASGNALLCPICRKPVDKDAVIKKLLADESPASMKTEDAFGLPGNGLTALEIQ